MKYTLVILARKKIQSFGKSVTPERFIYDAHEWSEEMVSLFRIKTEYEDMIYYDKLSDAIEDYALAILSERSIPLWANSENPSISSGRSLHLNNVKP